MDVCKLRGAFLRCRYSVVCLVAAIEAMLETYQEMGLIGELSLFAFSLNKSGF
jgi:hypothetical protein